MSKNNENKKQINVSQEGINNNSNNNGFNNEININNNNINAIYANNNINNLLNISNINMNLNFMGNINSMNNNINQFNMNNMFINMQNMNIIFQQFLRTSNFNNNIISKEKKGNSNNKILPRIRNTIDADYFKNDDNKINACFMMPYGEKIIMANPPYISKKELLKNFIRKIGLNEKVLNESIIFVYNGQMVDINDDSPFSHLENFLNILVIEIGGTNGSMEKKYT